MRRRGSGNGWRFGLCLCVGLFGCSVQAGTDKILYHIHDTHTRSYQRTISNLENLKKGMPDRQLKIVILLQGESLDLLNLTRHPDKLNQRMKKLLQQGAVVETGRSNYQKYPHRQQLLVHPGLVDDVFSRIIELKRQGYLYITP